MQVTLLAFALQLRVAGLAPAPAVPQARPDPDSQRIVERARGAQSRFERDRRNLLAWTGRSDGRCDVRIGRFCWWNDAPTGSAPREPEAIARRRAELLAVLDSVATRHPGDDWIAGMRVFYLVEAREWARADSAATACRGTPWWCAVLRGYGAHRRGAFVLADSSFRSALAAMPDSTRCTWRDIAVLLPGDARERYEKLSCEEREPIEQRYWLLGMPRLAMPANEWRTEFYSRRVVTTLAERGETPYGMRWGHDNAELTLRYGWPTAWSRVQTSAASLASFDNFGIVGHDPSPSLPLGPREELLDSLASASDDGWDPGDVHAPSRYAIHLMPRVVTVRSQLARFRRGDSTLVVAAFAAEDDSLRSPSAVLGVALADGSVYATLPDFTRAGRATLALLGEPRLVGVEVADSLTGTLARSRLLYAPRAGGPMRLSDLLFHRYGEAPVPVLDSALARALPGEVVNRSEPLGVYWETYGVPDGGDQTSTEVTVERIDHGFFRGARQRLGLADPDSPLRIRWSDARAPVGGVAARAISLDLENLPGGRYRVSLTLTPAGGPALVTAREIQITEK